MQRKDSLEDLDAVHSRPHAIEENKTESSSTTRMRGALRANAAAQLFHLWRRTTAQPYV